MVNTAVLNLDSVTVPVATDTLKWNSSLKRRAEEQSKRKQANVTSSVEIKSRDLNVSSMTKQIGFIVNRARSDEIVGNT